MFHGQKSGFSRRNMTQKRSKYRHFIVFYTYKIRFLPLRLILTLWKAGGLPIPIIWKAGGLKACTIG